MEEQGGRGEGAREWLRQGKEEERGEMEWLEQR